MNTGYGPGDIGMAAFSVFFMQSPSFLSHQRYFEQSHGRSNCASLGGIAKIRSDNHIRDMLDPASPALLHPAFAETVEQFRRIGGGCDVFRRPAGHVLIALDGTEYHRSRKIHCQHCSMRVRGQSGTEYYHGMLAATLVEPGHDEIVPLEPEFIVPQDGAEKQDCENRAASNASFIGAAGPRFGASAPADETRTGCSTCRCATVVMRWRSIGSRSRSSMPAVKRRIASWRFVGISQADRSAGQLRHRPARRPRHLRRTSRMWSGEMEDRERDVQRPEEQGL